MKKIYFILAALFQLIISCGPGEKKESKDESCKSTNYNISIFLDLSNRIDSSKYPKQVENDLSDLKCILDIFKTQIDSKKADLRNVKDRLVVYFHPEPTDNDIKSISEKLSIDFSRYDDQEIKTRMDKKRELYKTFYDDFTNNIKSLYDFAKVRPFTGSDIYNFFDELAKRRCVSTDSCSRNILIVFTDGYMSWGNDRKVNGNYSNSMERNDPLLLKLRSVADPIAEINNNKYGFSPISDKLESLEVLILEINPENTVDSKILKTYWENWLTSMSVKSMKVVKTDQPTYIEKDIRDFFKEK